jgi:hypothetical protein
MAALPALKLHRPCSSYPVHLTCHVTCLLTIKPTWMHLCEYNSFKHWPPPIYQSSNLLVWRGLKDDKICPIFNSCTTGHFGVYDVYCNVCIHFFKQENWNGPLFLSKVFPTCMMNWTKGMHPWTERRMHIGNRSGDKHIDGTLHCRGKGIPHRNINPSETGIWPGVWRWTGALGRLS